MSGQRAWPLDAAAPVAWQLDVSLLGQLAGDAWLAVGERWGGDEAGAGERVALACAPAVLEQQARQLEGAGVVELATIDWPLTNRVAAAEGRAGDHRVWTYRLGDADAATFAEAHQLAVVHPRYEGMLAAYVTAQRDVGDLRVEATGALVSCVTAYHAPGALRAGQRRAVDLQLHAANIPRRGAGGELVVRDGDRIIGGRMRLTLATSQRADCSVAGDGDGPLEPDELERVARLLLDGSVTASRVAWSIERAERRRQQGEAAPGALGRLGDRIRERLWGVR